MTSRARTIALELALPATLVAVWWQVSSSSTSVYFPPLSDIVARFRELWLFDRVGVDVVPSLINLFAGEAIAIAVGIAIGFALGSSPWLHATVSPVLEFLRCMPAVVLLPLAIQLLGLSHTMRIAFIAFGAMWPVLLNTIDGVRSLDPAVRDVMRAYRISPRERMLHVVLPAASPRIFVGVRASLAVAVILMVASELLGASAGIGFFVLESQRQFSIPEMWSGILLLGMLGYSLNLAFGMVEHRMLRWHRGLREGSR